ncbi:hypothetical protein GCM10011390_30950 [Aureimonas endophytica]|uniref:Uncharacterized protein n=1 Tax=Aureimonas endophytica TaxID=2027858 RepID=A0A916ZQT5_9HYPH|nr:hypothetical protein GCM10011390_30950 [Aureimonas endophytica]
MTRQAAAGGKQRKGAEAEKAGADGAGAPGETKWQGRSSAKAVFAAAGKPVKPQGSADNGSLTLSGG